MQTKGAANAMPVLLPAGFPTAPANSQGGASSSVDQRGTGVVAGNGAEGTAPGEVDQGEAHAPPVGQRQVSTFIQLPQVNRAPEMTLYLGITASLLDPQMIAPVSCQRTSMIQYHSLLQ